MLIYSWVFKFGLNWSHRETITDASSLIHIHVRVNVKKNIKIFTLQCTRKIITALSTSRKGRDRPRDSCIRYSNSISILLVCGFVAWLKLASSRIRPLTKYWQTKTPTSWIYTNITFQQMLFSPNCLFKICWLPLASFLCTSS